MPNIYIVNVPHLSDPFDEPLTMMLDGEEKAVGLSEWIKFLLRRLPVRNMDDALKSFAIMEAIKGSPSVIELASEDHKWMNGVFFDDAVGKDIFTYITPKDKVAPKGAWVAVSYTALVVPLQRSLVGSREKPKIETEEEAAVRAVEAELK